MSPSPIVYHQQIIRNLVFLLAAYEQHGVGEYWLVDPQLKQLTIFGRDRQKFTPHNFDLAVDPVALSHALTGFQPRLAEIFRER